MITVIGIADGEAPASALRARVMAAQLLAGGARHLALFPEASAEPFVIANNIPALVGRIRSALDLAQNVVVLASGDPLLYGIGATLRRYFAADQLEIIPAVSSIQRAFAAIGEPWQDALLLSVHGRPLDDVIAALTPLHRAAILTDAINTPALIARKLFESSGDCPAVVCEQLGLPAQRIICGSLSELMFQEFDPLNVFLLLPTAQQTPDSAGSAFGLPDDAILHDGLITHLEVRAVSIASLRLKPESILWDLGAGSGSLAIDASRIAYRGSVYAIERDMARYERLCLNLTAQQTVNIYAFHGEAPESCAAWPAPDAVFLGGSGGRIADIVDYVAQRLQSSGRLVVNMVTLERMGAMLACLRSHAFTVSVAQIQVSRSRPLQDDLYLAALNPVFILTAEKKK